MDNLLIANRGEIAVRIMRSAAELGIRTIAVCSEDDADSMHVRRADDSRALTGTGPSAYLDAEQILAAAKDAGADAIHPGYGFLSESAAFARACAEAGLTFVGPRPETLEIFGDKIRARTLAQNAGIRVLPATTTPTTVEQARTFIAGGALVVKAVAGGGGRGMRFVEDPGELDSAFERSTSEALQSFGSGDLYVERYLPNARHVEVQIAADRGGSVAHLWDRDCSLQRRWQKLVEIAPAPWLEAALRQKILAAAVEIARTARFDSLGTFEFLVSGSDFYFIETNPRLQVEHTVTEEVMAIDLVKAQLMLASGRTLSELRLDVPLHPRGIAIEFRVNAETIGADGVPHPASGMVSTFEPAGGPGIRVDTAASQGMRINPNFDSLLAKIVVHAPSADIKEALVRATRALDEFRIEGPATNLPFLRRLARHPDFLAGLWHTRFVDERLEDLIEPPEPEPASAPVPVELAGAQVDKSDPLAVLEHGKTPSAEIPSQPEAQAPEGALAVPAPLQGTIVSIDVRPGDRVAQGRQVAVMESMKMEHVVAASAAGVVRVVAVSEGDTVFEGTPLLFVEPAEVEAEALEAEEDVDLDAFRPDLAEVVARHEKGMDGSRPDAVERRRKTGQRTARENVEDLCDDGTFVEYGPVVIAAQRRRRPVQELIDRTPADGLIAGIGRVNGRECVVMSYDYTVLAGTQGMQNHRKKDRMFELAERYRLPLVFFTEGGGGRPGDSDGSGVAGLDVMAFHLFGRLSGLVPLVGVNSGRCFAGNAALLGCCDVVIATENSTIGMGGPAMIEGGGLGVFRPDEVGPMDVQVPNGVVDIAVSDEGEAVRVARQYLSYFQGRVPTWTCADQRLLRRAVPENRLRVYDVRAAIETLADTGSVLEIRRQFGQGMVTALARIEGQAIGVIANNPVHLAGAIDSAGADKASRFMQLCDAFDIPILFLCDTPGIMVGPDAEKTALVRHASRMFVVGANLTVPFFTIVLRKGYGLGAQAMAGGSFKAPVFTVAWPTGEFGGMGLEGAVKLGYRNELAAIEDADERMKQYEQMVARMYEHGKALNTASHFEIDDVIDPAESRRWITAALRAAPAPKPRDGKKRPNVDTW